MPAAYQPPFFFPLTLGGDPWKRFWMHSNVSRSLPFLTSAAQYVGCHPQTITNTAKANAKFAKDLQHKESSPELRMLSTVAEAGNKIAHAAKWGLERIYPDTYRPRQPGTFSVEAIKHLLIELAARLATQAKSDDERRRVLQTMAAFGKEMMVVTQPFVQHAIPLLAEITALGDDEVSEPPTDPTPLPEIPAIAENEPPQENTDGL